MILEHCWAFRRKSLEVIQCFLRGQFAVLRFASINVLMFNKCPYVCVKAVARSNHFLFAK